MIPIITNRSEVLKHRPKAKLEKLNHAGCRYLKPCIFFVVMDGEHCLSEAGSAESAWQRARNEIERIKPKI